MKSYDYLKKLVMLERKESPLKIKSEAFSTRIIKMYRYLIIEKKENVISKQIYRSGTSVGANIAESRYAQSRPDFVTKLSIALKEAEETAYWIKCLRNGQYITQTEFESINNDVNELISMLVSSIKTIKKNG